MPNYLVMWAIDVDDATNPIEAAKTARESQTNPDTLATVFSVLNKDTQEVTKVDLLDQQDETV